MSIHGEETSGNGDEEDGIESKMIKGDDLENVPPKESVGETSGDQRESGNQTVDRKEKKDSEEERKILKEKRKTRNKSYSTEKSNGKSDEEPEAPTLSLGERVVWIRSKGPEFGTVRWVGRIPKICASWTVGVEFVSINHLN